MISISMSQSGITSMIANIQRIQKGDLPRLKHAVQLAANHVANVWRGVVAQSTEIDYEGNSFRVSRRSGNYERSIQVIYPYENDLTAMVKATAKYAMAIERGVQPYDMKPGLLKGRQFVRIPFRHATPGRGNQPGAITATGMRVMSQEIYDLVKKAGQVGSSPIGQRSKIVDLNKTGRRITYTWKSGMYSGMANKGRFLHSQYITFRTVSINSNPSSWWHPGSPPRPLSKAVAVMTKDAVGAILSSALSDDLSGV